MHVVDYTLATPEQNLRFEEELLAASDAEESTPETLRFWEAPETFVVLGRSGRENLDINVEACRRDRVAVVRRTSGGGAVLQGPGCLSFSLILSLDRRPELRDLAASYRVILELMARSLGAEFEPASDLAIGGKKFSGNAQRRKRRALLHHGTILYAFEIDGIERYLQEPARQPPYRAGRRHRDFLANLPLGAAEIRERIARACASL